MSTGCARSLWSDLLSKKFPDHPNSRSTASSKHASYISITGQKKVLTWLLSAIHELSRATKEMRPLILSSSSTTTRLILSRLTLICSHKLLNSPRNVLGHLMDEWLHGLCAEPRKSLQDIEVDLVSPRGRQTRSPTTLTRMPPLKAPPVPKEFRVPPAWRQTSDRSLEGMSGPKPVSDMFYRLCSCSS